MSNREHKKLLRAIRHQQPRRERQQLAQKIDRGFLKLSEGCSERVFKAVNQATTRTKTKHSPSFTNCCLPSVALYRAGYRN